MPHLFWDYTLEEVRSISDGYIERLKMQRRFVEVIYHSCSQARNRPEITKLIPLPGDQAEEQEYWKQEIKFYEDAREFIKQQGGWPSTN